MLKSALKKSRTVEETQERRRVTFCKTVEVYGYPSLSDFVESDYQECGESLESLADIPTEMVEEEDVSIEEPEDYLVHKVVYEDYEELSPTGSLQDLRGDPIESDTIVYYPYEAENELQEFVVHCVNMLEERKDHKCVKSIEAESTKDTKQLCKLSVENIEQHNKLTENKILIEPQLVHTDVILSPPLQELAVEHLISVQSEEWLWNLDISPLNSIQESDSGSNISSEDTMIMMTSAECEKNEQRILESLQKFESIKKLKNLRNCDSPTDVPDDLKLESLLSQLVDKKSKDNKLPKEMISSLSSCCLSKHEEDTITENVLPIDYTKVADTHPKIPSVEQETNCSVFPIVCKSLVSSANVSLDDSLTSITIPDDVRDWKIELPEEPLQDSFANSPHSLQECNNNSKENCIDFDVYDPKESRSMSLPDYTSDELESFVDQCTERIERIKKRYSMSECSWTPRRGIRPRFGSTIQILKQLQSEGDDKSSKFNHHYSWPCSSSNNAEIQTSSILNSQSNLLQHAVDELSQIFHKMDETEQHKSKSDEHSNPHLTFHERGVPEGSSPIPPQQLSELFSENTKETDSETSDGVIYYSMNI